MDDSNLYIYSLDNPNNLVDPDGNMPTFPNQLGENGAISAGMFTMLDFTVIKKGIISLFTAALGLVGITTTHKAAVTGTKSIQKTSSKATTKNKSKKLPVVYVSKTKYPESAQHIEEAQKSGQPSILTRCSACIPKNRKEALKGIPTLKNYDRDEYPFASTEEGGKGADVDYVYFRDNRGSGTTIKNQLKTLGVKQGEQYIVRVIP